MIRSMALPFTHHYSIILQYGNFVQQTAGKSVTIGLSKFARRATRLLTIRLINRRRELSLK
jgi:hypothetical protein